jgi:hypothetical protein
VKTRSGSLPGEGNLPIETVTALHAKATEVLALNRIDGYRTGLVMCGPSQGIRAADCAQLTLRPFQFWRAAHSSARPRHSLVGSLSFCSLCAGLEKGGHNSNPLMGAWFF